MYKDVASTSFIMFVAVVTGSVLGLHTDFGDILSNYMDYLILGLVFLVLADAPLNEIMPALKQPLVLAVSWVTNFLVLPVLGFTLTKLFLPEQPLLAIGLAVYFMSPCTDWFLGFTRMANGNTALGSVLLPINMITQFLLYPFYLEWFSESTIASIAATDVFQTFFNWFMLPAAFAVIFKLLTSERLNLLPTSLGRTIKSGLNTAINWVMYALVFTVFCINVIKITEHLSVFMMLLVTVFAFFVLVTLLTEVIARKLRFNHADHVLYTITTTARNAPLMLGLTMTALPNQPLIYAAIIMGMVMEFPFLALQVFRFQSTKHKEPATHTSTNSDEGLTTEIQPKHDKKKKGAIPMT